MYIVHDRFSPHIQEYVHAKRIKNLVLRYWPTRTVDGHVVMDKLFIYIRGQGVIDTKATQTLFKLMNIDIDNLKNENWDGVENYYIYWKRFDENATLTVDEIKQYIETHSLLVDGVSEWQTANVKYVPLRAVPGYASDAEILQHLETADSDAISFATEYYDSTAEENVPTNRLLGIALLDVNGVLFEKQYRITNKRIGRRKSTQTASYNVGVGITRLSDYLLEANIEVKYRRVAEVDLLDNSVTDLLNVVKTRLETVGKPEEMKTLLDYSFSSVNPAFQEQAVASKENSINASLENMYFDFVPFADDDLYYTEGGIFTNNQYVKKSGLEALKSVDFVTFFGKSLKTGYTEEEAEWYEELLAIILAAIVIAIAVFSGGTAAGWALSTASQVFAFLSAFALALAVGTFVLQAIASVAQGAGYYGFAATIGKVVQILGVISTIAGIVSIYAAWKQALAKHVAAKAAAEKSLAKTGQEITEEAIMDLATNDAFISEIADAAIQDVALSEVGLKSMYEVTKSMIFGGFKTSMMDIVNKTISAVNWVAGYFMEKDLAALQGDLTAQEEKADELKQQYELYRGSVDKVYYNTSEMYDGYYNPYFNDFELSTGEGPDRVWATKAHWRCQNSIDWIYPK